MTRNELMLAAAAATLIPAQRTDAQNAAQKRPNIVFVMMEDLSTESFALYNGHAAKAPNLENMATHGIIFDNAYSAAPVSSAARSSLFTGCYAPSMGLSWHRKLAAATLPEDIHVFSYYLQQAGYYTTNAQKTDYNFVMQQGDWDNVKARQDGFRKRPSADMPFFHVVTDNVCHESSLQFKATDMGTVETMHSTDDVVLYPIHPDTPLFRYTYARHYDAIYKVDQTLGRVLDALEEDGLLDDTFVFCFGDNGGCLPGTKAYCNDLGLHVPMVVYVPDHFKNLAPYKAGEHCPGIVSFLDLAPTVLHLAGVDIPAHMDGQPILGDGVGASDLESMDVTVCYGDRFDELYAFNRVVRKKDFSYSRNFYPYHPRSVYGYYRLYQPAFAQWYEMHEKGELNPVQDRFFQPQGAENLYLLSDDPFETEDLAERPEYAQMLRNMRRILDEKMTVETDLGIIPESLWLDSVDDLETFKESIKPLYAEYLAAANLPRLSWKEARKPLKAALRSDDEIMQFWGTVACCHFGKSTLTLKIRLAKLAASGSPIVRSKAAVFAALWRGKNPTEIFNTCIGDARNEADWLMVLNDAAFLFERCPQYGIRIEPSEGLNDTYAQQRLKFINGE